MTAHPIPPLLILPPIALTLTVSSALTAYLLLMCCFRSTSGSASTGRHSIGHDRVQEKRKGPLPTPSLPPPAPPAHQDVFSGRSLDDPQIALPAQALRTLQRDATAPGVPILLASPAESTSSRASFEMVGDPRDGLRDGVAGPAGQSATDASTEGGEQESTSTTWSSAGEGED